MKYKERNLQAIKTESVFEWNEAEKQNAYQELKEVYRKAEAFDRLYAEFDKGDKDLSKADFDAVYKEDK